MPDIRLVIFDCDGVLVDSEPLAVRVLRDTLARRGLSVSTRDAYARFLGRSLGSVVDDVEAEHGLRLTSADLAKMREELAELFRAELQPVPHVAETVAAIAKSRAVCVASSSLPERLRLSLGITGLAPHFEGHIYSASEVARGKPAPDLFLHAARNLGVPPHKCLVIEDSAAGVGAARAAGMHVFGFCGGAHAIKANLRETLGAVHPDKLFDDMRDLPQLLATVAAETPALVRDPKQRCLIAVDVGTASVRAGVLTPDGALLSRVDRPIALWRQGADIGEYASEDIWQASCAAVRGAISAARVDPSSVAGIGFDATCSLVVLDRELRPLSISVEPGAPRNIIAWFDHRAISEAIEISATGHPALDHSGGALSPEMEIPKLMWLKRHRPDVWDAAGAFFDLADYLTWRASGVAGRSQSTLTSKWAFLAHEPSGWNAEFLELAGLGDLRAKARLPDTAMPIGARLGPLTPAAASDLGLPEAAIVATGMIDAHACAIGVLAQYLDAPDRLDRELALIAGTSSCIVGLSPDMRPITGIWGPYLGAGLPGLWLNEGGQSATGALLDHIIREHSAGGKPNAARHAEIVSRINELRGDPERRFAEGLHVLPDFHGNRTPFHDPRPRGAVIGAGLEPGFDGLCALYWRTAVGLAMGLRQILEVMEQHGYSGRTLHVAGGHAANGLLMELYTNATGYDVVTYPATSTQLTGMAMGAAVAAGLAPDLATAGKAMHAGGETRHPRADQKAQYDADYAVFLRLQAQLFG